MSLQYGELWPLMAEIGSGVWGTTANFNCVLASLLQQRRSPEANQTLHDVWPSPALGTPYIHFRGLLPADGILPGAKFTLHPSLAFFYIGSVTACHSSSRCQPNFLAWYKELLQRAPPIFSWAAITMGISPHSSSISVCIIAVLK